MTSSHPLKAAVDEHAAVHHAELVVHVRRLVVHLDCKHKQSGKRSTLRGVSTTRVMQALQLEGDTPGSCQPHASPSQQQAVPERTTHRQGLTWDACLLHARHVRALCLGLVVITDHAHLDATLVRVDHHVTDLVTLHTVGQGSRAMNSECSGVALHKLRGECASTMPS